jgi:hypothetical protein
MGRQKLTEEQREANKSTRKEYMKAYWAKYYAEHKDQLIETFQATCAKPHICPKCGDMTKEGSRDWYCKDCRNKYIREWLLEHPHRKCACGNTIESGRKTTRCKPCSNAYQKARRAEKRGGDAS